jgi:hypothetical protein
VPSTGVGREFLDFLVDEGGGGFQGEGFFIYSSTLPAILAGLGGGLRAPPAVSVAGRNRSLAKRALLKKKMLGTF